jgi:hypothetical protein
MQTDYSIGIKRISEITCCLKCGNSTVKETRKWELHTCGHWNESITFQCGARYEFTPNFMKVGLAKVCTYDPEFKKRKELTAQVKKEIFELAEKRGIYPEEMTKLKSNLEYWHPSDW